MEDVTLLDHVVDIVSSHVSNNSVATNDLPRLIQSVYTSLVGLGLVPEPAPDKAVPAVSVRSSVKSDGIACLECGRRFKMLKRHLQADHAMTPVAYRTRWNLPADYPMVAPEYSAVRAKLAVKIGLGRKAGPSPKVQVKAGTAPKARRKLGIAFTQS